MELCYHNKIHILIFFSNPNFFGQCILVCPYQFYNLSCQIFLNFQVWFFLVFSLVTTRICLCFLLFWMTFPNNELFLNLNIFFQNHVLNMFEIWYSNQYTGFNQYDCLILVALCTFLNIKHSFNACCNSLIWGV